MTTFIAILADTVSSAPAAKPQAPGLYQFFSSSTFPLVIIMLVLWMYVFKKKPGGGDKAQAARLKELKRGDRIKTIGGILGTVVEARDNEVVVKVDETNNTKIKFSRTAIALVVDEEKPAAT